MRPYWLMAVFTLCLAMSSSESRADIAPPIPAPTTAAVKVYYDEKAKESRMIVPSNLVRGQIRPIRPGVGAPPNVGTSPKPIPPTTAPAPKLNPIKPTDEDGNELPEIDLQGTTLQEQPRDGNRLMMTGIALTMAFACGGLWLLRKPNTSTVSGVVLLVASGIILGGSTLVWANAPAPPPRPKPANLDLPSLFDGKFRIEVVPNGDTISIVLNKETLEQLKKDPKDPK